MKLEYLYCKERLEDDKKLLVSLETARAMMTAEEREAENRASAARFKEIWAQYLSRIGQYNEYAFKLYQKTIRETEAIAREFGIDLTAEWGNESGWIELASEMILIDDTGHPFHNYFSVLTERCSSYSFMATQRYGRDFVTLTFHFSFIYYPDYNEPDEV